MLLKMVVPTPPEVMRRCRTHAPDARAHAAATHANAAAARCWWCCEYGYMLRLAAVAGWLTGGVAAIAATILLLYEPANGGAVAVVVLVVPRTRWRNADARRPTPPDAPPQVRHAYAAACRLAMLCWRRLCCDCVISCGGGGC